MPSGAVISAFVMASAVSWVFVVLAWRRRTDPARLQLIAVALVSAAWTTAGVAWVLADALPYRLALLRLQLALGMLAPAAWLALASGFSCWKHLGRRAFAALAILATAAAVAMAALPIGPGWLVHGVAPVAAEGRPALAIEMGPWFWSVFLPYTYLLIGGAVLILAVAWHRSRGAARHQASALLVAMAFPFAASLLQALGASPLPAYDIIGLAHGLSALAIVGALLGTRSLGAEAVAYREVFVAMREPALVVAPDGRVIVANPAATRWLEADLDGQPLLAMAPQLEVARRAASRRGELRDLAGDLTGFAVSVSHLRDHEGSLTATVLLVRDRRQECEREQQLVATSHRDGLTGIANRRGFEDALETALARRGDRAVGVAFVDLDGFKPVNDVHGHAAGDAVLVEIARRLAHVVRGGDTVARVGGDEFALLLVDATPIALASVAERAAEALSRPIDIGSTVLSVGGSIGLASAPRDGTTVAVLMETSDQRMYRQKQARAQSRAPHVNGHADATVRA